VKKGNSRISLWRREEASDVLTCPSARGRASGQDTGSKPYPAGPNDREGNYRNIMPYFSLIL